MLLAAETGPGVRPGPPAPRRPATPGELAAWRRGVADRGQVLICSDDLAALPAAAREAWIDAVSRHERATARDAAA